MRRGCLQHNEPVLGRQVHHEIGHLPVLVESHAESGEPVDLEQCPLAIGVPDVQHFSTWVNFGQNSSIICLIRTFWPPGDKVNGSPLGSVIGMRFISRVAAYLSLSVLSELTQTVELSRDLADVEPLSSAGAAELSGCRALSRGYWPWVAELRKSVYW